MDEELRGRATRGRRPRDASAPRYRSAHEGRTRADPLGRDRGRALRERPRRRRARGHPRIGCRRGGAARDARSRVTLACTRRPSMCPGPQLDHSLRRVSTSTPSCSRRLANHTVYVGESRRTGACSRERYGAHAGARCTRSPRRSSRSCEHIGSNVMRSIGGGIMGRGSRSPCVPGTG